MGSLLKRLAALLLLCADFTRPMHTGVIYVGQACRREALWKVWASHEEALLGPLRKRGEVSLFAWFDNLTTTPNERGWITEAQVKCYVERIIPLAPWTELVFDNPRPKAHPKETVMDARRRRAMAHFGRAEPYASTVERWVLLRPDLWFRTTFDDWGVDDGKDVNVAHVESVHQETTCTAPPPRDGRRPLLQGSDALYILSPTFMKVALDNDLGVGRMTMRYRDGTDDLVTTYGPAKHGKSPGLDTHVLMNASCGQNTRSSAWNPIYTIGPTCCYAWPNASLHANGTCTASVDLWPDEDGDFKPEYAGDLVLLDNDPLDVAGGAPRRVLNPPHCATRHARAKSGDAPRPAVRPLIHFSPPKAR